MNGQFLMNKAITVQYAFKKDGKGERHGTSAERLLAAQARKNNALPMRPPGMGAYGQPYQGQFAGVLAQPPPPPGFTPQSTMMPMPGAVPAMPPPPPNIPVYNPAAAGYIPPPPPPGFGSSGMMPPGMSPGPGMMPPMGMMPPPPPGMPVMPPGVPVPAPPYPPQGR